MEKKKTSFLFKIIVALIRLFYGKTEIIGLENLPEKDAILVANHAQMNGPIVGELFLPDNCYIWCAGQMMHLKEVPQYAFTDFWSQKPKWIQPFFKLVSYVIAPLSVVLFNNARTIPVYHDMRIMSTFKSSMQMLQKGANLLIFPEKDETYNNILYAFQDKFIDLARLYYKKAGKELVFVPMYVAPAFHKAYIGKGITFHASCLDDDVIHSNNPKYESAIDIERNRICTYLMEEITDIARKLPEHTVIPYRNLPKKYYLTNKDVTEVPHEKSRS
ncbi:MAG: hypothetical protein E7299_06310 [Lachnospiraceae bacterium]|nr:hypothetical protein [Lachnospiraceae bacterium]